MSMRTLLEEIIEDQINVSFTGRIQLLSKVDFSLKGFILFKEGRVIDAKYENKMANRGFISAMIHQDECKMILEAEFIEHKRNIDSSYRELIEEFEDAYLNHQYYLNFSVPHEIEIKANADFVQKGSSLSLDEYSVLLCLVKDGYKNLSKNLNLLDYEITKSLISLRKKQAIKTISHRQEKQL